jgi:hypothetical protein
MACLFSQPDCKTILLCRGDMTGGVVNYISAYYKTAPKEFPGQLILINGDKYFLR